MSTTPDAADPIAQAKNRLKQDFPNWSIVHSSADRWWAFLNTRKRGQRTAPTGTIDVDADTPEELHDLLAAAES